VVVVEVREPLMKSLHRSIRAIAFTLALSLPAVVAAHGGAQSKIGVLLPAHGGQAHWNQSVSDVARRVDAQLPTEVAFGMATRANIKGAMDRLIARGVTSIVAVPLFVSSHSSVITSTEFLLGLRQQAPADLARFAKMNHGEHGAPANEHSHHAEDPASPIASRVPVRMTSAFNRHPLVAAMLADRARSISTAPANEAVIVVAHGPVPDDDNARWLDDMRVLADHVRTAAPFASVEYMTVRDDAGPAIREAATRELRQKVGAQRALGRRVLIVPHLMSFGGIEKGLLKRLEGLEYAITTQALMPDDRIVEWVLQSAR
jgi:sirohydrochlorin ferrochelatase